MFKPAETSPDGKSLNISGSNYGLYDLNRKLDITKSKVFMGNSAAFLGPLMSMMAFIWSEEVLTAATNGKTFWWNPVWFLSLDPKVRETVLVHELWHVARLHMVRLGERNPKIWNYACDIRINNDLDLQKYSFHGTHPWLDHTYDSPERASEEDIYDQLMAQGQSALDALLASLGGAWGLTPDGGMVGDMEEPADKDDLAETINNVVQAAHVARLSGHAGDIPGEVEQLIKQFLSPVVPWETLLHKFFHDLLEEDYSWRRPNRRFSDIYLPSRYEDEGKLDHLIYYLDVSGSITDAQVIRFNSEVKYIKDTFNPKKLTLVQFDTRITAEKTFLDNEPFDELVVVGRGGTALEPVREHMIEHRPTAAVIFSDLYCVPMQPLPFEVPTIWVAIGNKDTPVPFGERINIRG